MKSRLSSIILLLFLGFFNTFSSDYIPEDVVPNYGEVKKLLAAFRKQVAEKNLTKNNQVVEPATFQKTNNAVQADKTEVSVNKKLWNELFEYDIILTLPQAKTILTDTDTMRTKRQADSNTTLFWPNRTISYECEGGDETWRKRIREALKEMEKVLCFKFKEYGTDNDALRYRRDPSFGCASSVGRIGGKQIVFLAPECDETGIIWHETLHALGLWHEQSRYDRDNNITLITRQIPEVYLPDFAKRTTANSDNLGQPYEYASIMHYPETAGSIDGSTTIIAKNKPYQKSMGQRDRISFKDAKMINIRYCSNICPQNLACLNGGYTDPLNCNKCRCPTGYRGTYCGAVNSTECGRSLTAAPSYEILESGRVQGSRTCTWRISSIYKGGQVELVFNDIVQPCRSCLEIKFLSQKALTGAKFCCVKPPIILSEGEDVIIIYSRSSGATGMLEGFSLKYRAVRPASRTASNLLRASSVATLDSASALWSDWGEWSACSQPCGGCGTRTRVRACYGGNQVCPGNNLDREKCNTQACAKQQKGMICNGRLLLPCDLLAKLNFGSNNYLNPKFRPTISQKKHLSSTVRRVKRQTATRLCEKRFTYQCPTALFTIEAQYKEPNLSTNMKSSHQHLECCSGYTPREGQCFKN